MDIYQLNFLMLTECLFLHTDTAQTRRDKLPRCRLHEAVKEIDTRLPHDKTHAFTVTTFFYSLIVCYLIKYVHNCLYYFTWCVINNCIGFHIRKFGGHIV